MAHPHPFRGDRIMKTVCRGATVADMLAEAGFHPRLLPFVQVEIEGTPVPRAWWGRVRPKEGCTVHAYVVPGKKGKNPLASILTLAVMAAAAFAAPYLAGTVMGLEGLAFTIAKTVIGAAITMLGSLAVNAIAPPPKPKNNAPGLGRAEEVFGISGIRNTANPYGAVPEIFGRIRVYPPKAAQTWTEIVGDDQYLRCLFTFGPGPFTFTGWKLGDTPIENFSGVEMQIRDLGAGDTPPTLYQNDVEEEPLSIELVHGEPPRVVVTKPATDEFSFDVTFPAMMLIDNAGQQHQVRVDIQVDYRPVGAAGWINLTPRDSGLVTLGNWNEEAYLNANPDVRANWRNGSPKGWTHWQMHGRSEGRQPFLLATQTHAFIEMSAEPKRFGVTVRPGAPGQYELRLTRITPQTAWSSGTTRSESFLTAIRSFHYRPPTRNTKDVQVALRIKASGQLNGDIDQLNCIAHRHLPCWTGEAWVTRPTRSPAWAYVRGLKGTARPLADARLQLADFKAWDDWCDPDSENPRRTFDARVDARAGLFDFLREVAATGRASFGMRDGRFSIVRDVPQSVPVQLFTPRNSWGFRAAREFVERPHALRCKFLDPDKGYEQAEAIVYDDGHDEASATLYETLEPFGCTRGAQAISDGRRIFAESKLRPWTWSLDCDIEYMRCQRGDLVRIAHDVIRAGLASGRVKGRTLNGGGQVTAVTLDEVCPMQAGKLYAAGFRRPDGWVGIGVLTQAGEQTVLTFSTPVAGASAPAEGCLFVFGEAERLGVSAIVREIRPGRDMTATLVMVPEAPELHAIDAQPIPDYVPPAAYAPEPVPGPVADLAVIEEVVYLGGLALPRPVATWRQAPGTFAAGFEVHERRPGIDGQPARWVFAGTTAAQRWAFDPRPRGSAIEIAVVAVSTLGRKRAIAEAASVFKVLDGPADRPADLSRLGHEITAAGRHRFTWTMPTTRPNFAGLRLRLQAGQSRQWESATPLHEGLVTLSPFEVEAMPSGTWTVLAKGVDTDGLESASAAAITLGLGDRLAGNVVETVDHRALSWPGIETGCADVGGELLADDPGGFMYAADTTAFYRATDDAPMFGADGEALYPTDELPMFGADTAPMYSVVFAGMAYRDAFTPPAAGLLLAITEGDGPIGVWLRRLFPEPMFGDDAAPMFGADADPMYPGGPEAFAPLVAGTRVERQPYEIEARIGAGTVRGRLGRFDVVLDALDLVERFDDVAVPAGGLRLPLSKPFRLVSNIQLTLQADGGAATRVRIIDKNAGLGPLIGCFDDAERLVAGTIDATVQGVQ